MFYNIFHIDIVKILESQRPRNKEKQHAIQANEDRTVEDKSLLERNPDKPVSVNDSNQESQE